MDERTVSANPQPHLMDFDDKLALFLDKDTLQMTVDHCVQKGISLPEVRRFTEPEFRLQLAKLMLAGQYRIAPPHIILIPKPDSAEMRKVYCNNPMDRVICTQLGSVYTRMYQDRIHPSCVSYQKGVGVPHIVRRISDYIAAHPGLKGAKFDIHHYFDEISCEALDQGLRELDSGSCIDRIVWDYLHDDVILDEHGQVQRVYKGIAQGFAVSPFLANYLLRDIDEAIAKLDVVYYRYSDDILLLGPDFEKAKAILYEGLAAKGLHINPRKVTPIDADTRFTFLEAPGHTPGTLGIFFNSTCHGAPVRVGMHGGVGRNTLESAFIRRHHLDPSVRETYRQSLVRLKCEHVDVTLGNHPAQVQVLERLAAAPDGVNPFLDASIWPAFLDEQLDRYAALIQNDPLEE